MVRELLHQVRAHFRLRLHAVQWRFRVQEGWRVLEFSYQRPWWALWMPRHVAFSLSREDARQLGNTLLHGGRGEGE